MNTIKFIIFINLFLICSPLILKANEVSTDQSTRALINRYILEYQNPAQKPSSLSTEVPYGYDAKIILAEQITAQVFQDTKSQTYSEILQYIDEQAQQYSTNNLVLHGLYDLSLDLQKSWERKYGDILRDAQLNHLKASERVTVYSSVFLLGTALTLERFPGLLPRYFKFIRILVSPLIAPITAIGLGATTGALLNKLKESNTPLPPAFYIHFGLNENHWSVEDEQYTQETVASIFSSAGGYAGASLTAFLLTKIHTQSKILNIIKGGITLAAFFGFDYFSQKLILPVIDAYRVREFRNQMYDTTLAFEQAIESKNESNILSAATELKNSAEKLSDYLHFHTKAPPTYAPAQKYLERHLILSPWDQFRRKAQFQNVTEKDYEKLAKFIEFIEIDAGFTDFLNQHPNIKNTFSELRNQSKDDNELTSMHGAQIKIARLYEIYVEEEDQKQDHNLNIEFLSQTQRNSQRKSDFHPDEPMFLAAAMIREKTSPFMQFLSHELMQRIKLNQQERAAYQSFENSQNKEHP